MNYPVISLCAIGLTASILSCNTDSSHVASAKDSTSQTTEVVQTIDSTQVTETQSTAPVEKQIQEPKPEPRSGTAPRKPRAEAVEVYEFEKTLTYKRFTFKVTAKGKGSLQALTIQPSGLSATNNAIALETDRVVDAMVNDLNGDGYPEVLVFTQSAGSGSYGKVVAYSVNNGKSMSRVTFPATSDNEKINKGYMGHDRFNVVNNQLTQTFPIYRKADANSATTKKDRVVTYKIMNGEASRVFAVDQVKETAHR